MADFDLIVRGGSLLDGNGSEPRTADVAVADGADRRGGHGSTVRLPARSTPTALLVTPGFVDIHAHYDGQATWDNRLQPVVVARRHHRGDEQLRRRLRAGARPRPRPAHRADGRRRGHPGRRAARGPGVELEVVRRVPRRRRRAAARHRRRRPGAARRAAAARDGRARARTTRTATADDIAPMAELARRGHRGRRARLHHVAHPATTARVDGRATPRRSPPSADELSGIAEGDRRDRHRACCRWSPTSSTSTTSSPSFRRMAERVGPAAVDLARAAARCCPTRSAASSTASPTRERRRRCG